jgi:hypothetical protein
MPAQVSAPHQGLVTREEVERLSRQIADLRAAVERHDASLKLGLTRMAHIQADIDIIRSAWAKLTARSGV